MEGEMPPAKKLKYDPVVEKKLKDSSALNGSQVSEQPVHIAVSPKTEHVIPPEIWARIFEYLPSTDLETVINTCPKWNKLLSFQKPSMLFPKVLRNMRGWLPKHDLLALRLISKDCKAGIDFAHPENLTLIAERQEQEREMDERRRVIQNRIQEMEIMLVEMNNRAVGAEENEVLWQENRRYIFNQELLRLRHILQDYYQ